MPLDLMDADAVQLGHSANMLAALAAALHGNRLPKHVRHACRESFALNAYLITGVLHDYGDHRAYDDDLRHTVEQHVLTYGDDRSSDTGTPLVEFDEDGIATDLLRRLDATPAAPTEVITNRDGDVFLPGTGWLRDASEPQRTPEALAALDQLRRRDDEQ